MSGIAFIIKGANYSTSGYGTVTPAEDVALVSMSIVADDSYSGVQVPLSVAYVPSNTNQKGVTWEITSGNTYASIDASTGMLTINDTASASSVTVKATSTANPSITASKTISVTYDDGITWYVKLTPSVEAAILAGNWVLAAAYRPVFFDSNSLMFPLIDGKTINHIRMVARAGSFQIGKVDSTDTVIGAWQTIQMAEAGTIETDLELPIVLGEGEYLALNGEVIHKNKAHQYKGSNTKTGYINADDCYGLSVGYKE